jgi:hypothetical protein
MGRRSLPRGRWLIALIPVLILVGILAAGVFAGEPTTGVQEAISQIDAQIAELQQIDSAEAKAKIALLEKQRADLVAASEDTAAATPVPTEASAEPTPHLETDEWDRGEVPCEPQPGLTDQYEFTVVRCVSLIGRSGSGLTIYLTPDGWALVLATAPDYSSVKASNVDIPKLPDLMKADISIDAEDVIHVVSGSEDAEIQTSSW